MKTLHVLNGDATAFPFAQSGLPGDVAIWREMLSEGPLLVSLRADEELWALRANWLTAQFGDRLEEQETYYQKVIPEFEKICHYARYDEIVFWFEHDLFCQINLVFLLAHFSQVDLGQTVLKLISVDQFINMPNFKGIGQLTGAQLASLYPQAETITAYELSLAARIWVAYAASDTVALIHLLTEDFGRLRYLRAALSAHLSRVAVADNGLPLIDNQLLHLIQTSPKTTQQVVNEWLTGDRIYGLGDWSVENHLTDLLNQGIIREKDGVLVPA